MRSTYGLLAAAMMFALGASTVRADGPCPCQAPPVTTYYVQTTCGYEPVTCQSPCTCRKHRHPIRRLLHKIFHPHECCPPAVAPIAEIPVPAMPAPVPVAPSLPAAPGQFQTAPPPPAQIFPPPPAPAGSIPPAVGSSYRVPTVQLEHLASYRRQ